MKLHVGNITKSVTDAELKAIVTPFGEPISVEIVRDNQGTSKGFGFIDFADADQARAAMTGLNNKELSGQALRVSEAKPRKGDPVLSASRT